MNQDTVSLLQPTVVVLRACGVCPSALQRLDIPTSNKIYGLLLGVTYVICCISNLLSMHNIHGGLMGFTLFINIIALMIQHLVLILSAFTSSGSLIKFLRIVDSIQRSFFALNIKQDPSPSQNSQIVWLVALFTPSVLTIFGELLEGQYILTFMSISESLVTLGTVCKMRVLMTLLDDKFDLLNWHFDDLNNRWPVFLPRPSDVSFREFSCVREWRKTKFINENEDTRTVTAEKVRNFNKAHLKLVYASRKLNSVLSIAFFVHILSTVITLSTNIPMVLGHTLSLNQYLEFCSFSFSKMMELYVIFSLASRIQEKAGRMALLVHDLLDEDRHPPDVVQQLEEFSMALLHRKTVFSAAGFFDVNLKLVSRIAGILAPIVLFLTQTIKNYAPK